MDGLDHRTHPQARTVLGMERRHLRGLLDALIGPTGPVTPEGGSIGRRENTIAAPGRPQPAPACRRED